MNEVEVEVERCFAFECEGEIGERCYVCGGGYCGLHYIREEREGEGVLVICNGCFEAWVAGREKGNFMSELYSYKTARK